MSEQLLNILKLCLLALLYLFFFRVLRAVWAEVSTARATDAKPSGRGHRRSDTTTTKLPGGRRKRSSHPTDVVVVGPACSTVVVVAAVVVVVGSGTVTLVLGVHSTHGG